MEGLQCRKRYKQGSRKMNRKDLPLASFAKPLLVIQNR